MLQNSASAVSASFFVCEGVTSSYASATGAVSGYNSYFH